MSGSDDVGRPGFDYTRDEPFSYVCNRCMRCCYGKRIPLNPYDLIRLAEVLSLPTGQLIEQYTDGGIVLKVREDLDGAPCVFLGPTGCTVHNGRPGACRVYPLGRSSTIDGVERFAVVEPHPETDGVYGRDGTIATYVEGQNAGPYFDASRRYLKLFMRLAEAGALEQPGDAAQLDDVDEHVLDVDATVARYCNRLGIPAPTTAEHKMLLHIEAIEAELDGRAANNVS